MSLRFVLGTSSVHPSSQFPTPRQTFSWGLGVEEAEAAKPEVGASQLLTRFLLNPQGEGAEQMCQDRWSYLPKPPHP